MTKRRKTVNNDHYTIVVTPRVLGFYYHVNLVSNYGLGIEEIVMSSENYFSKSNAMRAAETLSNNLAVPLTLEG